MNGGASHSDRKSTMQVSVLIATRDRPDLLACTLRGLARMHVGRLEWEVIVANNGTDQGVARTLEEARSALPLTTVRAPQAGKNRALNLALLVATGDLLLFTDDDVIPHPDWVAEFVSASDRWPDQSVFGGRTRLAPPPGAPDWIFDLPKYAVNFARYSPLESEGLTAITPYGPNFALRSTALTNRRFSEEIGPDGTPNYAMGSETELLRRILDDVKSAVYVPSAQVRHIVRPEQLEFEHLCARSFRMGRGLARSEGPQTVSYLFGAPRWLWRTRAAAALDCLRSVGSGGARRLEARLRYHQVRGTISAYREMSRVPAEV
jgi:glycosyltransferase involved in cell wall biosynthesis